MTKPRVFIVIDVELPKVLLGQTSGAVFQPETLGYTVQTSGAKQGAPSGLVVQVRYLRSSKQDLGTWS